MGIILTKFPLINVILWNKTNIILFVIVVFTKTFNIYVHKWLYCIDTYNVTINYYFLYYM